MPPKQIYRQVALERLSSPEQLDQLLAVTTPQGWLALIALGSLAVVAVVWSIFGAIPTKVAGQCIVLKAGGVNNVVALSEGQIRSISVEVGQTVRKGQVVARLAQTTSGAKTRVTSPYAGRVLEIRAEAGSYVTEGMPIISLETIEAGTPGPDVVVYVPAADGKKIRPGMTAQISPSTVRREEFGFMPGNVTFVSRFPATRQGMMQTLGSEALVEQFSTMNVPLEVQTALIPAPDTSGGYQWSSKGTTIPIDSGTLCSAQIIVDRQRPISLVIPWFKRQTGLY